MPRFRLPALTAIAGALLAVPLLATAPASAATGFINVVGNTVDSPASNPGLLSVTLASDMPITAMTVDIVPMGGGTSLLSIPMTDLTTPAQDGTGSIGTWTVTSPVTTGQLALGSYDVQVTATTADASVTAAPAGLLEFLNEVSFPTFTSNGTTFNYDNQNVTFTGTADVTAPGGTPQPFGTEPVILADGNGDSVPVTTATDGSFSVTVAAKTTNYFPAFQTDSTTASGLTPPEIAITVTQLATQLTGVLSVPHPKYAQPDEITGTATYTDGSATTKLTGATVGLYAPGAYFPGASPQATAITGTDGQYTMSLPTTDGAGDWTVAVPANSYLAASTATLPLTVANPNFITGFRGTLNAFGVVTIAGCVGASTGTVNIQYAAKLGGPWHTLGRWKPAGGTSCQNGAKIGTEYSASYYARLGSAYYRVVYTANYNSQGVTSKAVHLARQFTKITSFKVSPRSVARHGKFTVSGRLWAQGKNGKWTPYAHRRLLIIFHYQGVYYRYAAEPKTNGSGRFSGRFPVLVTAPLFAQYNGDSTHFASATARITVRLKGAAARTPNAAALSALRIARVLAVFRGLG